MRKFPPPGYRNDDHPLQHESGWHGSLNAEDETKNSTILTLFHMTEAAAAPENVEVNPTNTNFATDGGVACHRGSIIDNVKFHLKIAMTKNAIETDKLRVLKVKWFPIYISFLDNLTAEDEKLTTEVEDLLHLQHDTTNKDTYPLYTAAKLVNAGNVGLSTIPFTELLADIGLDTAATLESVAFNENTFWKAMHYYSNGGMLRKSIGQMHSLTIRRDKEYEYFSRRVTQPKVKRMNPYTFCGIMLHLPQMASNEQFGHEGSTTNIDHIDFQATIQFDEWNTAFEQATI